MLTITTNIYRAVSDKLSVHLEDIDYFNGTVEFDTEDLHSTLRATLIVYHKESCGPDTPRSVVTDIVPVWWEFETHQETGQVLNDFSWNEFKQFLI